MKRKTNLEKILKKGFVKDRDIGPSTIYERGDIRLLYHNSKDTILLKTKVDGEYKGQYPFYDLCL